MKTAEHKEKPPTTYDIIIGMIEGCMPNDKDVIVTEKLLDKLLEEYTSQPAVSEVEILGIFKEHALTVTNMNNYNYILGKAAKAIVKRFQSLNVQGEEPPKGESDKFDGIRYYAVSSDEKILAVGSSPDNVYFKAVANGCDSPIVIGPIKPPTPEEK
ncbi:hypothetical protein LCGC14_2170030 [marine sediment metagenome]|uniref:Uncharacterized protein n=1 Tax=marine sediment metagenome TaxID=412755 RepID=A0A0F9DQ66_9ZZZZ|nr:hypothetical protein [Candidatus Scalindua sp.]